MLKLAGLVLLFSSAAMTGAYAAAQLGEREQGVRRIIMFLRQFALQLECLRSSPGRITVLLAGQQEFAGDRFIAALAQEFGQTQSFLRAVESAVAVCPWLERWGIAKPLLELGDVIGVRELEGQLTSLKSVIMLLEDIRVTAGREREKKGDLYRRLGLLGGAMLAVLFF